VPLYEYQCGRCGHRFEKIQKFSDPPVKTCPKCRGKVRKLLSAPAFQFKGSGWYVTDYGRKGPAGSQEKADRAGSEKERSAKDDGEKSSKDEKGKGPKEKKDSGSSKKKNPGD
jgi:putative FmdB family regulatory protein